MHWSDRIADKVIKRNPNKEEYVCAAGISPSGSIHIGNFRDIATALFVCQALERKGKKALYGLPFTQDTDNKQVNQQVKT